MKKSFHFLWVSQLFANLGDVFYIVGLISILYQFNESTFTLALLPVLNMSGRMMSSSVAPFFLNRWRLKRILLVSQFLKTILLACLLFSVMTTTNLVVVCAMIFILALLDGVALPSSEAMLPRLVTKARLIRANSFLSMLNESTRLGGWALGGLIVAMTNGSWIIMLTLALYVLSTLAIFCIKDATEFIRKETVLEKSELMEGFQIIWYNRSFRSLQILSFLSTFANVVWVAAFIYIFVDEVLQVSEAWWGYINTSFFVGLLVGASVCMKLEQYFQMNFRKWLLLSSIIIAVVMLGFSINTWPFMALVLSAAFGFVTQLQGILMASWIQVRADEQMLAKIYSAQEVLNGVAFVVATLLVGYVADFMAIQLVFIGAAILLGITACYLLYERKNFTKTLH